jgi:hypothetical protein
MNDHSGTLCGTALGDGFANPGATAGDENNFVLKAHEKGLVREKG